MTADVNAIVRAYLLTQSDVTALVGGRIYCPRLPENAIMPAIGYRVRGGNSHAYIPPLVTPSIQFDCWAESPIEAREVYRALYYALQGLQNTPMGSISLVTDVATEELCYGDVWQAQTFTTTHALNVTAVRIKAYRSNTPGTVTVSIRATTAGVPSGADIASATFNGDAIVAADPGEWIELAFSGCPLAAATQYAIVVRAPAGTLLNRLNLMYNPTDVYSGGSRAYSLTAGPDGSWTATTDDCLFWVEDSTIYSTIMSAIEEVQGQDLMDVDIPKYFKVLTFFGIMIRAD